jgi:DNA-binding MarR family transcriptional regulator
MTKELRYHQLTYLNAIWNCRSGDISANETTVLTAIAGSSEDENQPIAVSIGDIAKRSRLGTQCVQRNVNQLIKKNFLAKVKEHTPSEPAEYLINMVRLKEFSRCK